MKGAAAIATILKCEGVDYLFCFPNNPLIDAVAALEIKPIMTRTERTAVAMADGYARVTSGRKIGVVAVQQGPGVENSFGGVAQAFSDSSPILVLPGGPAQNRLGQQPNFDPVPSFREITKWAERINSPDRISLLLGRAFSYLRSGRPGPVLLEVPADVSSGEAGDAALHYKPVRAIRSLADPADVAEVARAMLAARCPLIHAGQGVLYAEATDELVELAELLQAPVMTTLPGKSAFPENHPLSVGAGGNSGTRAAAHFLRESDLVFGIGASLSISFFAAPIPQGKVMIQATVDERDFNKDYPLDFALLGDARFVLRQLINEIRQQIGPEGHRVDGRVADEIKGLNEEMRRYWLPKLTSAEVPMNPYRVVWELIHAVDPRQTIITHDAGSPRDMLAPFWTSPVPHGYVGWGKSSHLGYGLGLAMGAKLAAPDKLVINFMGDAAIGMIGMDIETAARNNIGTLTIIINNSCLGGYDKSMHVSTERYGTRFLSGDYCLVAKGLGAYAEKVERPEEVAPAISRARRALEAGHPAVLEVIIREEVELSKVW